MLKVLYICDPNSTHNLQWIGDGKYVEPFLLANNETRGVSGEPEEHFARSNIHYLGKIPLFSLVRFWRTLATIRFIKKMVGRHKIDLIHILFAEPEALWVLAKSYFGVPMVVTTRGTDILKTIPSFFQRKDLLGRAVAQLYRWAFARTDAVTSTSLSQQQSLEKIMPGITTEKILIRTGIDLEQVEMEASGQVPFPTDKPYCLFPRMMKPLYNHEFAIEAISKLPPEIRSGYRFVFVHRDAPDREYVEKIEGLMEEASADFLFLDLLTPSGLHAAIKSAALTVMTPKSDGSSVTVAVCLYLKCPVLVPPLDYDEDIFANGINMFEHWESSCLANAMESILSGESSAKPEAGRLDVATHFDRAKEMARLRELYYRLTGRG